MCRSGVDFFMFSYTNHMGRSFQFHTLAPLLLVNRKGREGKGRERGREEGKAKGRLKV